MGVSLSALVFIVFLALKLAEVGQVATWSWWWVTSPLWIPICLLIVLWLAFMIFCFISVMLTKK
jgi:hypothetical protein